METGASLPLPPLTAALLPLAKWLLDFSGWCICCRLSRALRLLAAARLLLLLRLGCLLLPRRLPRHAASLLLLDRLADTLLLPRFAAVLPLLLLLLPLLPLLLPYACQP